MKSGTNAIAEPRTDGVRSRLNPAASALALALAGASFLPAVRPLQEFGYRQFADWTIFLFAAAYVPLELVAAARHVAKARPRPFQSGPALGEERRISSVSWRWKAAWATTLLALVLAQTLTHLGAEGPFLYLTFPEFPVGASTGADGYVFWLDGWGTNAESWQFARQAEAFLGAGPAQGTGTHDARALYSYLAGLLVYPLGYFGAFIAVNTLAWYGASLAMWYLGGRLLDSAPAGFAIGVLTATSIGFVFTAGTAMSYSLGYAAAALSFALAERWRLFDPKAPLRRWVWWGWLCGVGGLTYFTHWTTLGAAWLTGVRGRRLRALAVATAAAFATQAAWFLVGTRMVGLEFTPENAGDLAGEARRFAALTASDLLALPIEAGDLMFRNLTGGFSVPLLAAAAVGIGVAEPWRRRWYLAVLICGVAPAYLLHHIPVTQRYAFLAYPAVYVSAVEGVRRVGSWVAQLPPRRGQRLLSGRLLSLALFGALAAHQLVRANADVFGVYQFVLEYGGP